MEYLGHIVSHEGVKVEPNKIKAIKEWKFPLNHKAVVRSSQVNMVLLQVCLELWENSSTSNNIIEERCIFMDS